ncbi:MurR/RpiR family transcriptional regulator [Oscillibacter sp.]|jgi:DNA-binding MurR/RpiR family transcriptional regulator|uniref:MurR/RpiR family transcriptional regulator n=1 Tax=Oscillibacter sp. TaxID=1945593 RepID=UPI00216DBE98|nr:MurR/RpiR family transcriptional regulator [Oscillibacter sp.]MCI8841718.1 MurR/RpiR family transcriptional regulator [Oscillibacter sp.]MCI9112828.1 MurR/RpiR family transcriptional regulator [Oscillibacter sp.]MCI9239746.1 MurR/RpiR family transcriptional regulator [Oscillibacter sp.]MCI9299701.1 MurR/RpiR family transcriptional regulator [Oscillibacter sp.]MCI9460925.1 MurR/RpiR family transcriptional regulator [Oscillibacter sp.]
MGKDIIALMIQEYERFTRSERKIADYVLEHQEETQYVSITDLSAQCGVAVSTVSLFCRKLKLAGFNDFKLELARAALPARAAFSEPGSEITEGDSAAAVMGKVLSAVQDALNNAYHMLSEQEIIRAADLLRRAGQVVCLGQGNHSVVALAAWAQFSTTSPKFKTIQDSHMQTVVLSTLAEGDAVLYFSYSGATHELLEAVEVIRNRGGKLILVTRYPNSPASAYADAVLLCGPNEQPFQFGSTSALIAQLYVVEALLSEFIRRDPEEAEQNRRSVGKALTQKCV